MGRNDFLGVGWQYPFQFTANGGVARTSDLPDGSTSADRQREHITNAIEQVVRTNLGERLLRPEFGSRITELVFDAADPSLLGQMQFFLAAGVGRWEKRAELVNVDASIDRERGIVLFLVDYKLIENNQPGNMVLPFFILEGG